MKKQEQELDLLIKRNRRRFIGTIFIIIILIMLLIIFFIIKDNNKEMENPKIITEIQHNNLLVPNGNKINNFYLNSSFNILNSLIQEVTKDSNLKKNNSSLFNFYKKVNNYLKNYFNNLEKTKSLKDNTKISKEIISEDIDNDLKNTFNKENNTKLVVPNNKISKNNNSSLDQKIETKKEYRKLTPQEILEGKIQEDIKKSSKNSKDSKNFIIQTGAFSDKNKALLQIEILKKNGIPSTLSIIHTSRGDLHRVRIGSFTTKDQAQNILNKIKSINIDGIIIDNK